MEFLLEIPLVVSLADWIWGEDEDVTPSYCVSNLPLMNGACWSRLVAKGLGIAIILGACLNKAPVMYNIYATRTTKGLARASMYSELLIYGNSFFYGYLEGYPFTAFGENLSLLLQTSIITVMAWTYEDNPMVSIRERLLVLIIAIAYVGAVLFAVPDDMRYLLMASGWPILVYSRGLQILDTASIGHTGAQSIITTTLNLVGSMVRIADFLGVALNFVIFVQYWYYQQNTKKFLDELSKKKKE